MQEWTELISSGADLTVEQAGGAAAALLDEGVGDDGKAEFLRALAKKGETAAEIEGFVGCFLEHAVDPGVNPADMPGPMVDIVGTGGDKLDLFNISTTSMFVIAGGGACVVKHGNRAVTSKSGGADVLEALGVNIELPPERFAECLRSTGLGFLFAPIYHPAFKTIAPVRKRLAADGVRTIFNLLGPLLNPVRPKRQLIGVWDESLGGLFAEQMRAFGRDRAWIVHGRTRDGRGMDEISVVGETLIWDWTGKKVKQSTLHPRQLSLEIGILDDLKGGDAQSNATTARGVLDGTIRDCRRTMITLNAAAGFVVAGLAPDLAAGLDMARESIDSGMALKKLEALVAFGGTP